MNKQDKYRSIATGGTFFMYSNAKMAPIIAKLLAMIRAISISYIMSAFGAKTLEFPSSCCFLNANCNSNCSADHWVIAHTDQTHHFNMGRNR